MEPLCEFCWVMRAVVYCKSDVARLCLQCDGSVHSANALSRRHPRSLLCDKCNAQPAIVRCMDEKMSLCQSCQWNHNNGCAGMGHRSQALNCYTGCPSLAEFTRIWSSVLDVPSSVGSGGWESLASVTINETCISNCLEAKGNEGSFGPAVTGKLNELDPCAKFEPCVKFEPWMASSTMIPSNPNCLSQFRDQAPFLPQGSSLPKLQSSSISKDLAIQESSLPKGSSTFKDLAIQDGNDLCEGINLDDVPLNFENADEIFSSTQDPSRYQFEDGDLDCLLMGKNLSVTASNGPIENAVQASASGQQDCVAFQSSCGSSSVTQALNGSGNCLPINLGFPAGQVHSTISLSLASITRESNPDYQDCGLSPMFLTGEPWESTLEASSPQARDKAKMRYKEKKKTRMFGKQIRYASRKARADTRKRVKGRFVKAGEEYDYDPLVTRNF